MAMHADSVNHQRAAMMTADSGDHGSITMFRASGMVLLLASSSLLALGVYSACLRFGLVADRFALKGVVLAGSAVAAMLYASTINLSPCYNLLASTGAYAAAGMVLLATNRPSSAHKYILYGLAGGALGAEALCKASAGIATSALVICAVSSTPRFDKIFGPVAMAFGAVTFACAALFVNTTMSDTAQAVGQGMQLFRLIQVEMIGARLVRYSIEFIAYFKTTLVAFATPLIATVVYAATRRVIFAQIGIASLWSHCLREPERRLACISMHNATSGSYLFGVSNRYDVQTVALFAMLAIC
jgi:hypothetical protein